MNLSKKLVTLFSCLLLATVVVAQGELVGTVYQTANVRSGPDTRFEIVGQLSANDQVKIDGRDAETRWLHVILTDGKTGWLPVFALIVNGDPTALPVIQDNPATPPVEAAVNIVSYGRVNVRSGPGISYEIVAQLDVNTSASALARSDTENDWLLIRLGDNTQGWVAYFTVTVEGDPGILPVLVPDSSGQVLIPPSWLMRASFNVRLHEMPDLNSAVILVVPFSSSVTPIGRSLDGSWLFVGYKDQSGWGATQLFDISRDEVQTLPVYGQPSPSQATPEATAQP